jgi:ABC-type uncharacterized transport system ATPase subunit
MVLAVEMHNITKKFGNLIANNNINFELHCGEVHGLCGENGAGKTTLMNILYGLYQPDAGKIIINGKECRLNSPKDAISAGIGMVHQHFSLVPSMTVAENIVIGNPPKKKNGLVDKKGSIEIVKELSAKYGLDINPAAIVKLLPVGLQQRVEILKALYLGANILIMDEPTAVLTPQEISQLFVTFEALKKKNKSIILITHKLKEVKEATDRITVMRLGKITGHANTADIDEHEIARMMVGREVLLRVNKEYKKSGDTILKVSNISCNDNRGVQVVKDITLEVRSGEIVGIAGVQGNGQTELIEAITGLRNVYQGSIEILGNTLGGKNLPARCRSLGVGHISEDRQNIGSALNASIRDNFLINIYKKKEFKRGIFLDYKAIDDTCIKLLEQFDVRYGKIQDPAYSLSGGNLQKLIVAREIYAKPRLLIAAQPTRGVDIGATEFIHKKLIEQRNDGNAVLLVSNDLSEIMSLSDRIYVIYKGTFVGEVNQTDATEEQLGLWMAGITTSY